MKTIPDVADSTRHVPVGIPKSEVLMYEHFGLVERIEKKEGLSHMEAKVLFKDLLLFLAMCSIIDTGKPKVVLAPPAAIDNAWHHFILFTEDYAAFCDNYFGRFIHHRPATSRDVMPGDLAVKTRALAEKLYGELSLNWRCSSEADCSPSTNCESPPSDCALIH